MVQRGPVPGPTGSASTSALTQAYLEQRPLIRSFLLNILRNANDADDVLQETFIHIREMTPHLPITEPKAFVFRIASNLAIDLIRRKARTNRILKTDYTYVQEVTRSSTPADAIVWSGEWVDGFKSAVRLMPLHQRRVFIMHKLQGISHREIAAELGISVKMVEKHMAKAMDFCRRRLARFLREVS